MDLLLDAVQAGELVQVGQRLGERIGVGRRRAVGEGLVEAVLLGGDAAQDRAVLVGQVAPELGELAQRGDGGGTLGLGELAPQGAQGVEHRDRPQRPPAERRDDGLVATHRLAGVRGAHRPVHHLVGVADRHLAEPFAVADRAQELPPPHLVGEAEVLPDDVQGLLERLAPARILGIGPPRAPPVQRERVGVLQRTRAELLLHLGREGVDVLPGELGGLVVEGFVAVGDLLADGHDREVNARCTGIAGRGSRSLRGRRRRRARAARWGRPRGRGTRRANRARRRARPDPWCWW